MKITSKNIWKIFKEAEKALDQNEIQNNISGFIGTPYGGIYFDGNYEITKGNKKAVNWAKKQFGLTENRNAFNKKRNN